MSTVGYKYGGLTASSGMGNNMLVRLSDSPDFLSSYILAMVDGFEDTPSYAKAIDRFPSNSKNISIVASK